MELRRELQLTIAVLMGIQVLVALGSVLLFQRMAPAIELILEENVYSLEAIEDMLVVLVDRERPDAGASAAFEDALARAEQNITERRERPVVAVLEARYRAALAGDPEARREVLLALQALGEINRGAAVEADQEAKRLGVSGAWAVVFLGLIGFAWGVLALRRFRRRVTLPVLELHQVLEAHRTGASLRRCHHGDSVRELDDIQREVNHLLDLRSRPEAQDEASDLDRGVLLHFLEQRPAPTFVLDAGGTVAAANTAGLDRLAGDGGAALRAGLQRVAGGEQAEGLVVEELPEGARLVELRSPAPGS